MATTKQKRLARVIVENSMIDKPLNSTQIVEKSGYTGKTLLNPKNVIETEGVQEELTKLGFTEDNAMKVVEQIMNNEDAQDHNRLKATELVFKVKGTFAPEKKAVLHLDVTANDEQTQLIADEYESKLKGKLLE